MLYEVITNEAQKLENKSGIYLENPEVGFDYLWGDPSSIGTRKDFSVNQSFDFPTAYGIKKKIADTKNQQSDLVFELQRKSILYQAKTICNELIYLNALHEVLQKRSTDAENIAKAYVITSYSIHYTKLYDPCEISGKLLSEVL